VDQSKLGCPPTPNIPYLGTMGNKASQEEIGVMGPYGMKEKCVERL